jgi:DHA3 family tetracycline resistance protein-like MFS transporter
MRWKSATAAYLVIELIWSAAGSISFTVTAVYFVTTVALRPLQLVLVGTAMEATVFVFEIPTGVVADTFGRRRSLAIGWALQGLAMILVGAVPEYWAILAGFSLWGFGWTFCSGSYEAWITDEVGVERVGSVFARGTRIGYVGALAGMGASVVLAATFGLASAVLVGGALMVGLAVYGLITMPEMGFAPTPRGERSGWGAAFATARKGGGLIRGHPILLLIMGIWLFAGASTEAFDRLWEAHFIRDVGLPTLGGLDSVYWFGLFGAGSMLIGIVASTLLVKRFGDRPQKAVARMLVVVTVIQLGAAVLFGAAGGMAVALSSYWLYRLTRGLVAPLEMTWLNQNIDDSSVRATVISMTGQADAVGQTAGGPMLGAIGNAWGIPAALVAGALLLFPALGLYARALRHSGIEPELSELPEAAPA